MPASSGGAWKNRLHEIIFEQNTTAGKLFDVVLLFAILSSILVVMLDSIIPLHIKYGQLFFALEWGFTILFTIEYLLRIISVKSPIKYMTSFMGIIDLLAIIPTFLSVVFAGSQSLLVLRALRLLRIFRIFKLPNFIGEMKFLRHALKSSLRKITIFLLTVLTLVIILGSVMYLVERGRKWVYQYS